MIPELGHFALILAFCIAIVQSIIPLLGASLGKPGWMALARRAAWGQFFFISLAFAILLSAFINNDFSLVYVASNSNSDLPLPYRISALWGAHEGSLLLWTMLLSLWTVAVASFSKSLPQDTVARVIAIMGLISIGFLLFMLLTSNPFDRIPIEAIPANGRDLNPLLQDPGLVVHPPMLYMGYVGFSVAFAFAVAALLGGQLDAAWARWSRPWTAIAWVFLTIGIALGSWWAYYELGWGGWWFWDPVENASFMPWLVGTALMHSLAVTEKRNSFKSWTVLLAIFAFSLSLLGTFLVRSGVLTSVHAFATDPARGVFILIFLAIVVGGSLSIYAWRAPKVKGIGGFQLLSRETLLLSNNVLLVVATSSVLLGTVYPLVLDALDMGKISVGPPYFNRVFVPIMLVLLVLMGIGPHVRWRKDDPMRLFKRLGMLALASVALSLIFAYVLYNKISLGVTVSISLAFWIILSVVSDFKNRLKNKAGFISGIKSLPREFYSMSFGHLGIAIFAIGVTLTSVYSIEHDIRLAPGENIKLAGMTFDFLSMEQSQGPNYESSIGHIRVSREGKEITVLHPEKRFYFVQNRPMTEASIDAGLFRDIYISLGEPLPNSKAWAVRIYYKPFIRWIWLGALVMAFGGLLSATDKRYRLPVKKLKTQAANLLKQASL
ncbi:Cytochrome c heme lyase subunit CcmF [hydrothermal vent metagenome]|uniref:Cytochrome c heme lyase subunit CcmF n=1 Tax=hydrothermal vent metagenome TaxID=652676 RepID=A0A3B1B5L8_9ZZZZ